MNIGILTQPLLRNYGGILQNYALQVILKRLGHNPITVDYCIDYTKTKWVLGTIKRTFYNPNNIHIECPNYDTLRPPLFDQFVNNYINHTSKLSKVTSQLIKRYKLGAIIVGSDQVWRPQYNGGQRLNNMFLDFAKDINIHKIAYAASFGTNDWEFTAKQTEECRELVKLFDDVSVREDSGVNMCREYFDITATQVLDPTLLLDKDDYCKLCKSIPSKRKHIFAYILDKSNEKESIVNKYANLYKLPANRLSAHEALKDTDSIENWLSEFRDAEYIVTDSFHGVVFSIIFNKPFCMIGNHRRGNSRFDSLLSLFDLHDKISIETDYICVEQCIFDELNKTIRTLQSQSINYINDSLSTNI